jgi:predicted PurR-regulated permease PerM
MRSGEVVELAIRLGLLAILIYWSFVIAEPFIPIVAWSIILVVALYPPYEWLAAGLGGRRRLAAAIVTLACVAIVAGPVTWLGTELIEASRGLVEQLGSASLTIPPPRESIKSWPVIGGPLYDLWNLASTNLREALQELSPYFKPMVSKSLALAGGAGAGAVKFVLALVFAGFLFAPAPRLVKTIRDFLTQFVPDQSEEFIALAAATIRSVSQGVVGVSLLQGGLAAIVLKVAGVPGASILAFMVLLFGILQIGSVVVVVPVVIWAWFVWEPAAAALFTACILPVGLLDNVLRPIIMGRGLKTPTMVILIGIIGGTLAHGIVGLFVGPVVLAVGWELLMAWLAGVKATRDPTAA